jgi:hypothetical protein
LNACVANEEIKVRTVNGRLIAKTLMTVIKNESSLRISLTIISALINNVVDIKRLDINPIFNELYIDRSTFSLSSESLLTKRKTPLSNPINANISAILVIAFPREYNPSICAPRNLAIMIENIYLKTEPKDIPEKERNASLRIVF